MKKDDLADFSVSYLLYELHSRVPFFVANAVLGPLGICYKGTI